MTNKHEHQCPDLRKANRFYALFPEGGLWFKTDEETASSLHYWLQCKYCGVDLRLKEVSDNET